MAVSARKLGMGSFEGSRIRAIFLHSSSATRAKYQAPSRVRSSVLSSKGNVTGLPII